MILKNNSSFRAIQIIVLLLSCLTFCYSTAIADVKTDSLLKVIEGQTASKEKVDNMVLLIKNLYRNGEPDRAKIYCDAALSLSSRLDYQEGIMDVYYQLMIVNFELNNYYESMNDLEKFLKLAESDRDTNRCGIAYLYHGKSLHKLGRIDEAPSYFLKALHNFELLGDNYKMIVVYNELGNLYQDASEYDTATIYYMEGVELAESSGNETALGSLYNNLGKTFSRMGDYEESNRYLLLSLEVNAQNDDIRNMALNRINIGNNYLEMGNTEKALENYDQATELLRPLGDVIDLADLYNNYALVYVEKGMYDLALSNYEKALEVFRAYNDTRGIMIAIKNKGDVYSHQGQYDLATRMYETSIEMANEAGYRKNEMDFTQALAYNYFEAGDHRKAFESFEKYLEMYQSLFDLDQTKVINELKLKYEKEKDQTMILILKNEKLEMNLALRKRTNQRNAYFFLGIGIVVLAFFLLLYFRQKAQLHEQRVKQLEEEKKFISARLLVEGQEQERKRIARELHDGLGVLLSATKMQFTSIKGIDPENQPIFEKATQMLEQATGDVRQISHNMMPGLLTKLGLYEAVEDIFENLVDHEHINAVCEITGEQTRLPENKEIMLYRIIQELVNNSIKHAKASDIKLQIKIFPGQLLIKYTDNGVGFDVDKVLNSETESFGLKSVQSRVGFLNGEMAIESKPGEGVQFTIQVSI